MNDKETLEHVGTLDTETRRLLKVRNDFGPIYDYYFPKSWGGVIRRALGASAQPDFARYAEDLTRIKETASNIAERSKAAYQAIQRDSTDRDIEEWAEVAYKQIYLDASSMMIFREYCVKMQAGDPEAIKYMITFRSWTRDSARNLRVLQSKGSSMLRGLGS